RQEVGIELPEKVAGGALDLDQCGEVIGAGRPDRHSGSPLHCDHGTIPRSGSAGSSSIAKYSSRWPSGSRKYTAAAGRQPSTLGSVVSAAWNDSGVTPCARRRSHASSTPSSWVLKATCSASPIGEEPIDQRPSIDSPGRPIQKNAAPRAGSSST